MSKKSRFNSLTTFLGSKKGRLFFHITYSVGAAVVILGALAKIIHMPMGNMLLIIGMLVEALVFLLSAFDVDQLDFEEASDSAVDTYSPEQRGYGNNVFAGNANVPQSAQTHQPSGTGSTDNNNTTRSAVGGGTIIGGGTIFVGTGGNAGASGVATAGTTATGAVPNSGTTIGGVSNIGGTQMNISEEYLEEIAETTQKMASFSKVMSALNDMSEKIMSGCEQINEGAGEFGGLSNNMAKLNENVSRMNSIYEAQLGSIEAQMNTLQYINQTLDRIKSLYGNTLIDSDMFRIENEKMARQIQELNRIYARLLQAMNAGVGYNPGYNAPNPGQGYNNNNPYPPQPQQGGGSYNNPNQGENYNPNPQY